VSSPSPTRAFQIPHEKETNATISSMTSAIGRSLVAPIRTDAGVASGIEVSISKKVRHGLAGPAVLNSYANARGREQHRNGTN